MEDVSTVRKILGDIFALIEGSEYPSGQMSAALSGDDSSLWTYLMSNELWGGAGSIADEACSESPCARKQLEILLIRLGREQISRGRANVRTQGWVTTFNKWHKTGAN